jgi:hypothetical protein
MPNQRDQIQPTGSAGRRHSNNTLILARWPLLLSDVEAGEYLGISRSLVREYLSKGKLHRVGLPHPSGVGTVNRLLIHRDELDAFANQSRHTGEKL